MRLRNEAFKLAVIVWLLAVAGIIIATVISMITVSILDSPHGNYYATFLSRMGTTLLLLAAGVVVSFQLLIMSLIGGVLVPSLFVRFYYLFVPLTAFIAYLLLEENIGEQIPSISVAAFNALGLAIYIFFFLRLNRRHASD